MDLQVPLEPGVGRQAGRVDRLDRREMSALGRDLAQDGVALAVRQAVILGVDPDERGEVRMVAHDPSETTLDQIVEPVVERSAVGWAARLESATGVADGRRT